MTDFINELDDLPSRSQLKRDNQELRDMGEQLVLLAKSQLDKITLDDPLEVAIKEAGKLMIQGKEYVVNDGDVMHFRFNV